MGNAKRQQVTEQVTKAVKSAGGLVTAALIISGVALVVAAVALMMAVTRAR
jgi:hypothetical protein